MRGIFHRSGKGDAKWAEFAAAISAGLQARTGRTVTVVRITTAEYPTPARRPANSRLNTTRLADTYEIRLPPWRRSLAGILDRLLAVDRPSAGSTERELT